MSLGMPEILILLAIALLFFGPSRLPSLGKSVGEAIRGFKKGIEGEPEEEAKVEPDKLTESQKETVSQRESTRNRGAGPKV